jgi:hypothetical protein
MQQDGEQERYLVRDAVCFPLPTDSKCLQEGWLPRLGDLIPQRWRRRVVIQGQRFWLPG